jgi:hypothetical protein
MQSGQKYSVGFKVKQIMSGKKEKLSRTRHEATEGGVEVYLHSFLTWALGGGEWSTSFPGCLGPRASRVVLQKRQICDRNLKSGHSSPEREREKVQFINIYRHIYNSLEHCL